MGGGSNAPSYFGRNQYQLSDDFDLLRGFNHFVFGGEAIILQMNSVNVTFGNGEFAFNGSLSNDPIADFMLGRPSSLLDSNTSVVALREKYYGLYFQDDIRVSKRLSIHAGVRWEPSFPEHDAAGRGQHFSLPAFIAGQKTTTYLNAPPGLLYQGDPGIPAAYANGSYLDFAPRFGLAWDPTGTGKQSIRVLYTPVLYRQRFCSRAALGQHHYIDRPGWRLRQSRPGLSRRQSVPESLSPTKDVAFNVLGTYTSLPLNLHHMYIAATGSEPPTPAWK